MSVCVEERRAAQLKPSKWPFRMRSPIGDGARGGRGVPAAMVFDLRALRMGLPAEGDFMPGGVVLRGA